MEKGSELFDEVKELRQRAPSKKEGGTDEVITIEQEAQRGELDCAVVTRRRRWGGAESEDASVLRIRTEEAARVSFLDSTSGTRPIKKER